jgi:hypothetical protein
MGACSRFMSKFTVWLKSNWRLASVVVGGALLLVSAGLVLLVSSARLNGLATNAPEAGIKPSMETSAPKAETLVDAYAVSIDNQVDARPASGLTRASVVYEVPVEGGITRFLAVFVRGVEVPEIGPVRSARPYFLDWVSELGPSLFFHFGGSPEAMARIDATSSLREGNVDGTLSGGGSFWRDSSREAPHNAYMSSANAEKVFVSRAGGARTVSSWLALPDPETALRGTDGTKLSAVLSKDKSYNPDWVYVQGDNLYRRQFGNVVAKGRGGETITAKNVIVMKVNSSVVDSYGRLNVSTSGTGTATLYHNGQSEDVTWKNEAGGGLVRFYSANGMEAVLTAGNVWIEVAPIAAN